MARLNTFYLPPDQWPDTSDLLVTLKGPEARHMGTVLRTEKGRQVRLFDGQGREGLFEVQDISKSCAQLAVISLGDHTGETSGMTLAIGWGKSKRRNYLFEKMVELHGEGVVFWQAVRSQGRVPAAPKETWPEKCIQAAKQCGNTRLPTLQTAPDGVESLVAMADDYDHCFIAWESEEISKPLTPSQLSKGRTLVVIGPEGGFDRNEATKLIDAGFVPVTLGSSIMRWETAATYCLSLAFFGMQETK